MTKKQTAIVTGAYGAIGAEISRGLAVLGYTLVLAGRDKDKLEKLAGKLRDDCSNNSIRTYALDLSRKKEIEDFARWWEGPLNLLVNNAATAPRAQKHTPEGIEMQFATNVLGYFWMITGFSPFMEGRDDARVVNVASYWAGDLDLDDLEFIKRPYDNDTAYRQSKQADRMLTAAFAERLRGKGIMVLSAHPGDVSSGVSNSLGYGGWEPPAQGAATPLYCATDPGLKGVTGRYFEHKAPARCRFSEDTRAVEALFNICSSY